MISAHQSMPQISVNYFCVENNYFIVALCYSLFMVIIRVSQLRFFLHILLQIYVSAIELPSGFFDNWVFLTFFSCKSCVKKTDVDCNMNSVAKWLTINYARLTYKLSIMLYKVELYQI